MFCICILFVFVILYLCSEWSTSSSGSSVGFRLSSQVGFVYSAPLTFLPGQTRKLHTIARSARSLCAFVYFVFAYEFRPSHIMVFGLLTICFSYDIIIPNRLRITAVSSISSTSQCNTCLLHKQCTRSFAP